jgi:endonuclease/exonuclease/phosphatase family metal-dependent hydrolase
MRRFSFLVILGAAACAGRNYPEPNAPRYAGAAAVLAPTGTGDTLRVVSFNVEYAEQMASAIQVLRTRRELRDADVVLLQEMTAVSAKTAAEGLGMRYVYYPAIYNRVIRHDIGNAVLSRWPIVDDAKVILPSQSRYAKTQRIATRVSVRVGDQLVRVYSTHLGTALDLGREGRAAQIQAIIADAGASDRVVIGGDMNSAEIGQVAREAGFLWPTDTIPKSSPAGRLDHLFLRGLAPLPVAGVGTVRLGPGVSDHNPIWARLVFDPRR